MQRINLLLLTGVVISLLSCAQSQVSHPQYHIEAHKPFAVTQTQKRINTMACQDKDDWYLEGYRVGKSFSVHKQSMLSKRTQYCEQQTQKNIPDVFLIAWETGFQQGLRR